MNRVCRCGGRREKQTSDRFGSENKMEAWRCSRCQAISWRKLRRSGTPTKHRLLLEISGLLAHVVVDRVLAEG